MKNNDYLNSFLTIAMNHLNDNKGGFLNKLEKGDVAAIKLLLDYVNRLNTAQYELLESKKNKKNNIKGLAYDKAFDCLKENITEVDSEG